MPETGAEQALIVVPKRIRMQFGERVDPADLQAGHRQFWASPCSRRMTR